MRANTIPRERKEGGIVAPCARTCDEVYAWPRPPIRSRQVSFSALVCTTDWQSSLTHPFVVNACTSKKLLAIFIQPAFLWDCEKSILRRRRGHGGRLVPDCCNDAGRRSVPTCCSDTQGANLPPYSYVSVTTRHITIDSIRRISRFGASGSHSVEEALEGRRRPTLGQ